MSQPNSRKNSNSENNTQSRNPFSNDDSTQSNDQPQQQGGPTSNPETRHNSITSDITQDVIRKNISFKNLDDGAEEEQVEDGGGGSGLTDRPSTTNLRGREMSDGAASAWPNGTSRKMSEGAESNGPATSYGTASAWPNGTSRKMSEGAESNGPVTSNGTVSAWPNGTSRKMSGGAESNGPVTSNGTVSAWPNGTPRKMSEGAESNGPVTSYGPKSVVAQMPSEADSEMDPAFGEAVKSGPISGKSSRRTSDANPNLVGEGKRTSTSKDAESSRSEGKTEMARLGAEQLAGGVPFGRKASIPEPDGSGIPSELENTIRQLTEVPASGVMRQDILGYQATVDEQDINTANGIGGGLYENTEEPPPLSGSNSQPPSNGAPQSSNVIQQSSKDLPLSSNGLSQPQNSIQKPFNDVPSSSNGDPQSANDFTLLSSGPRTNKFPQSSYNSSQTQNGFPESSNASQAQYFSNGVPSQFSGNAVPQQSNKSGYSGSQPPYRDEPVISSLQSSNQNNSFINSNLDGMQAVAETQQDKEWISKFEQFAVKFLNKIFRRTQHERKLKEAVKIPDTCNKNGRNFNPATSQQSQNYNFAVSPTMSYPLQTAGYPQQQNGQYPQQQTAGYPLQGQQGSGMASQPQLFTPPPPIFAQQRIQQQNPQSEEMEEAAIVAELNAMLDDINRDVNKISPEYLSLVTPLFGIMVALKGKDFRKTDNRDIFRKVDDYAALINCGTHKCLKSVMYRLHSLFEFINVIKTDSENLRKFPRIITKCYETNSKVCQEVCEVYSDEEFQTVNIKKMCKLKPKPPERPPWRMTYKVGDECFGSGKQAANTCSGGAQSAATCGIPAQKLFREDPKCCNPPPVQDSCFGGQPKWKKKFPCGEKNACCKGSCRSQRDTSSCCPVNIRRRHKRSSKNSKKNFLKAECSTSTSQLQPPRDDGDGGAGAMENNSTMTPEEFSLKMVDMFNKAVQQGESAVGYRGGGGLQLAQDVTMTNLARDLFSRAGGEASSSGRGYNMSGMVATQTKLPPGSRNQSSTQPQNQNYYAQQNHIVQMMQNNNQDFIARGIQTYCDQSHLQFLTFGQQTQPEKCCRTTQPCKKTRDPCLHKRMQTFCPDPSSKKKKSHKVDTNLNCSVSPVTNDSRQSCQSSCYSAAGGHNRKSSNQLCKALRMSNDQLAGLLARLLLPQESPSKCKQNSRQVCSNFVAQMCAAGNISGDDADRMNGLIYNGFPLQRADDEAKDGGGVGHGGSGAGGGGGVYNGVGGGGAGGGGEFNRPTSATKGAQCTISQIRQMTASHARLKCDKSHLLKICGEKGGCPSAIVKEGEDIHPNKLFTTTQVYTGPSGSQLQHTRALEGANGAYSRSMLCITASKPSMLAVPRCDSHHRPVCMTQSKRSVIGIPRCNSKMRSKPRPSRSTRNNVCVTNSQPSAAGIPRCPSATNSKPSCVTKSKPSMVGVYRCKTKPLCTTTSQPGLQKCVPAVPINDDEPMRNDEPEQKEPDVPEQRPKEGVPYREPYEVKKEEPPKEEADKVESETSRRSSGATNNTEGTAKTRDNSEPPEASPKESSLTPTRRSSPTPPPSDKSNSISSRAPSLPPSDADVTEDEELEWPSTPPRGPLEKTPSTIPAPTKSTVQKKSSPPPPKKTPKPGKSYESPFKFTKVKIPEGCDKALCDLPECHPLKTPYPPQYRFDEVRMRRYMEQCHQLKKICSHPPGEQCWTPPPPPLPSELMARKPPFPPDPCNPPLFPGTNLGMGCSYGLPSGNCYSPYEQGRKDKKPEDCFFDCGGICPMGMLGETCPQQPPPYSKLKKKKKKDEVFQFDYITVMREKTSANEPEGDYCDQLKRQRRLEELEMMKAAAAADQCDPEPSCASERRGKSGPRRPGRKSKGRSYMPDCMEPATPPPPHEVARFLQRPDVQVVKEQKTEIVKKHGCEGPEKFVSQMEAYYTKTADGRIATEMKDTSNNNNNETVEQWIRQDADATLRKHNRGLRFTGDCPVLETDWEKEFKEFEKSCGRTKSKGKPAKPLPPGFIPCPLPETTTVMCRVPDPNSKNVIQCQAIPFPMGNVGNANTGQYGMQQQGVCQVGGGGMDGASKMAGVPFMIPPPRVYGGYDYQQQQTGQMFSQGFSSPSAGLQPHDMQTYQSLLSGFPGGVLPPPPQQYQQQIPFQQQSLGPESSQQSNMSPQRFTTMNINQQQDPWTQNNSPMQQPQLSMSSQPWNQYGTQAQQSPGPQQQQYNGQYWNANSPPPPTNGYEKYSPNQPIRAQSNEKQGALDSRVPPPQQEKIKSQGAPQKSNQPENSADSYPYMCEIRYHEPIHGSIYGRIVTRQQPCRLLDPNQAILPGHNPNCPVIMETSFFNPSCPPAKPQKEK